MNSKHFKYMAAIVAVALSACSSEEIQEPSADQNAQLAIVPTVGGTLAATSVSVSTRAGEEAGADDLSENNLGNTLDIFIAGKDGDTYWNQYHLSGVTAGTEKLLAYDCLSGDKGLTAGSTYNVYVSANNTATNGTIDSEAALKALSITDADIYRHEGPAADAAKGCQNGKRFAMDYTGTLTVSANDKNTINAQMSRAAAKFRVKVKFADDFYNQLTTTDGYTINSPAWRLFNCNTAAPVFADGDAIAPVLATAPRFSLDKADGDVYEFVTYSYPFSWTDPVEDAPYILFSYGLMKDGKSDTGWHYYRIPLTNLTALERNHVYEVTATIKSLGSTTPVASTDDVDLTYKVVDWTDESTGFSGVQSYYLIAVPDFTILTGQGTQSVTIGITAPKSIWAQGASGIQIRNIKSYYYDKDEVAHSTTDSSASIDYTNHTVTVNSTVLANHAVKYINFEVYYTVDGTTYSQKVYVKHYPDESIEPVKSSWASRNFTSWVRYGGGGGTINEAKVGGSSTSVFFRAKVYNEEDGKIYPIETDGTMATSTTSIRNNNHMYIIQLTSPGSTYSIGHYANENERVASPAFMIASELGAINSRETYAVSKQHCVDYLEVAADGTEWTGWRLPTIPELQIISKYQNADETKDIISQVLPLTTSTYYSITSGKGVRPSDASEQNVTASTSARYGYVRAVRDLTAEEVARLRNNKKE